MVKIILLKKEYLNSISGQNELVDIINSREANCLELSEEGLSAGAIIMEAEQCCSVSNDLMKSLFYGEKQFEYRYSIWECELNRENVTEDQVKDYFRNKYPQMSEKEIEDNITYSSFHDAVDLKYLDANKAKEISQNISFDMLKNEITRLEQKMGTQGIAFSDWNDEESMNFIKELLAYANNAAEEGTGILYAKFFYE